MNRTLNVIAFVVFASALFSRSIDPVVPQIAQSLQTDVATVALLSTAFALPFAAIQPLLGALADMFNKALLMMICLAVLAAATVAGAMVQTFPLMVATRALAGIAAGGLVPIAFAIVGDLVPINQRQVAMGRLLFAIMTGNLLGATSAGFIGDLFGWRAVLVSMAITGFCVLVLAIPGLRGAGRKGTGFDMASMREGYRAIFANPLAKVCYGAVFVEGALMYGMFPHLAGVFHDMGETRASIPGLVIGGFAIGGAIYSVRVGWLLRVLGETWMMRAGGLIMGLSVGFIALRMPWQADIVDFAVLGLGFYMLHAVIQIYASELAPAARGSSMALHSFFFYLGQAAGAPIYKIGFEWLGTSPAIVTGGIFLMINGIVTAHYLRRPEPT